MYARVVLARALEALVRIDNASMLALSQNEGSKDHSTADARSV